MVTITDRVREILFVSPSLLFVYFGDTPIVALKELRALVNDPQMCQGPATFNHSDFPMTGTEALLNELHTAPK